MVKKLLALMVVVSACSTGGVEIDETTTTAPADAPATTATAAAADSDDVPGATSTTQATNDTDGADPYATNAAVFVASLEESFLGTSFSGSVLESPEVYLAAGEVICVRLDNGDTLDGILEDYLSGLLSNTDSGADTISESEAATVAGAVLGASLELFCPQHKELLEE